MKIKKKLIMILLLCVVLLGAVTILCFLYFPRSSDDGLVLTPSKEFPLPDITYYLQNDPAWADDRLGESTYTMKKSGCLVSCIASLLTAYDREITPGELNRLFTEHSVYNGVGDVVWSYLQKSLPDLSIEVFGSVDALEIEAALERGVYPLVKVKYLGTGYWHWVLLIGSDENGYLCMDPLNEDLEATPLSTHGDKVYAYRLLY